MFTYFYNNYFYYFIKSGLLLDFYIKKLVYKILSILYLYFNIFFSEKYLIEQNFLKILLYLDFYKNFLNFSSQYFSVYQIGLI